MLLFPGYSQGIIYCANLKRVVREVCQFLSVSLVICVLFLFFTIGCATEKQSTLFVVVV
jgi:hypothetical protein